jgi:hypothetical protein
MAQVLVATSGIPPDPRTFIQVRVGDVLIAPNAQRETKQERVEEFASGWDWLMAEAPSCSLRNDRRLYAMEGQTRILGLQRADPDAMITVIAIRGLTQTQETEYGLWISQKRKPHSTYAKWNQRLQIPEGVYERAAQAVLTKLGLTVGEGRRSHVINAIDAVLSIMKGNHREPSDGAALLEQTLAAIVAAFTFDPDGRYTRFESTLLKAVSEVIRRNPGLDHTRLVKVLSSRPVRVWMQQIATRDNPRRWEAIGMVVVGDYNHALRTKKIAWQV